jgi:hypothetical protein
LIIIAVVVGVLICLIIIGGIIAWLMMSSSSPLSERVLVDLHRDKSDTPETLVVEGHYQAFEKNGNDSPYAGASTGENSPTYLTYEHEKDGVENNDASDDDNNDVDVDDPRRSTIEPESTMGLTPCLFFEIIVVIFSFLTC